MPTGTPKNGINKGWFSKGHIPTHGFKKGHTNSRGRIKSLEVRMATSKRMKASVGDKGIHWKGGKLVSDRGYISIYCPNYPYAVMNTYVLEHRLVVEKMIGRYLLPEEVVHHLKGRADNNPQDLMAFVNQSAHMRFERGGIYKPEEIIYDGRKL